ncbi:MAG: EAL domain-containing protein [Betaproteobacteria bacterium]|nr:EAL domain-containing protein [Betaproteobacteria bacterium]
MTSRRRPKDAPVRAHTSGQAPALESLAHATILMVDDDPVMLEAVRLFLEDVGYGSFVTTTDPGRTLSLIAEHEPDVVLLDLKMPGMSGFDVLAAMRTSEGSRFLPVIVLSADSESSARLQALELGATDFLMKPVDPSELQLRVRNTLAFKAYQDRLADYDPLSGLRNRRRFESDLRGTLAELTDPAGGCALLHVDLDRFKHVNDTLGYRTGDRLLKATARRVEQIAHDVESGLISTVGETDARVTVAHIAGNGFAVLVSAMRDPDNAERIARAILKAFSVPFQIENHQLFVSASVGVSLFPVDAQDADALLKHAEMAMYQAKNRGRNTHEFFSQEFNARAGERLLLETELRRAIERNELVVHYQPKVSVVTGRVLGAEALIRWNHPQRGMVSPAQFIPIAEETGLIVEIGRWVLGQACRQLRRWQDAGLPPVTLSVNVSPAQFSRSAILKDLKQLLASTRVDPKHLVLEVTEGLVMADIDEAVTLLKAIRSMGVRLSIDDFGTGYSSLAYLRRLPIDEIKIDRSFVKGLPEEKDSLAIVRAVTAMGHALGLKVVAEGVETHPQLEVLRAAKCDEFQGYYCSRPVPAQDFAPLLDRRGARPRPNLYTLDETRPAPSRV